MSLTLPSLSAVVDVFAQRCSGVAAISLVVYDIMITMDKEIQHFWGRSFSIVQVIYFLNRYYGLLVVAIYLYGDMIQVFSDDQYVILFDRQPKRATILLGSLYFAQCMVMVGVLIAYDREFNDFAWQALHACGTIAPTWFSLFWIPTLIFEFILLCMTLYKGMLYKKTCCLDVDSSRQFRLHRILVRGQVIYFTCILLSGSMNIILWKQLPGGTPNNEAVTLSAAVPCVLGSRILLSLRDVASQQEGMETSEESTDMSELVF
ncbi:uncharacterized protein FOMMEDRAFT_131897 [Fomitiporia mediterranea MF3/22]|uniref:uncharacterized protein n=1 Tax=Fomitiporia mediterranea (strain MF3/22) TaxID=694068 RepID=UPI000440853D|nr:uncharacterized protein FOMMEDRAFT_131897 [Fomitiporia mediterranea MF3/22]EJD05341.1 hypothetical protein FOMMEDRAFT_131897 [Fomitiporia mediterranea MF3/22]